MHKGGKSQSKEKAQVRRLEGAQEKRLEKWKGSGKEGGQK